MDKKHDLKNIGYLSKQLDAKIMNLIILFYKSYEMKRFKSYQNISKFA